MAARTTLHRRPSQRTRSTRGKRPAARQAPHQAALQRFLERLATALTTGDGDGAADCFEYPALMVMSQTGQYGGNQALPDHATVAKVFRQAPQQYHAKGIQWTFPDIERVEWLAPDLAQVQVRFPYVDADGNDMGDGETSAYVIRKTGSSLAICAAITLGVDSERGRAVSARP